MIGDGGSEAGQLEAGLDGASGGVLRVAGRAGDRRAGADLVRRRRPDVAVVDLAGLPAAPSEAADTIRELHAASPSTRLLAVAGHADADLAVATLNAGALGFVVRPADLRDLVAPVMTVASGHTVVPRDLLSGLVGSSLPRDTGLLDALTPEYADLWRMVADGLETTQIAERLYVSERTAKRMVAFLLRRLGVANRIQAAALAGQAGLLDDVGAPS